MNRISASGGLVLGAAITMLGSGCIFGINLVEGQADAMRAEIEAMAADRSSTQDSDCGVVSLYDWGLCDAESLVYSRATVDEYRLLARVEQYNHFQAYVSRLFGAMCLFDVRTAAMSVLVSENGVCVLKSSTDPRATDLVYGISGGFAGITHVVRITPGSQIYVSDNNQPESLLGSLTYTQTYQLNSLLLDWGTLPATSQEPICCDGFGFAITYHGRTLSWAQEQENVPARLSEIAGLVTSIEQGF
jgi:hypothetical protein